MLPLPSRLLTLIFSWGLFLSLFPGIAPAQSVFTVNTTVDESRTDGCTSGTQDCSLRGAIELANQTANVDASTPDRIEFDIDGSGPHVIPVGQDQYNGTGFAAITEAVVIDGTSEPDYDNTNDVPSVVLHDDDDGGYSISGLRLEAHGGSMVKGLAFTRFTGSGVAAVEVKDGSGHTIERNYVGIRPDGTSYGNTVGIHVEDSPDNHIEGNRIRSVEDAGVMLEGDGSLRNRISQNVIYESGTAAIDLGGDGLTPNDDVSDGDTGANTLLNTPVISSASYSGGQLSVTYNVRAASYAVPYPLTVEFFLASADGQAERYLGTDSYATSGTKTATFSVASLSGPFEVVATATDANGNTSELGITLPPESNTYAVTNTADRGPGSLRRAIRAANNDLSPNTISFSISGGGPHTIAPAAALPKLYGPVIVDGRTEPDYVSGMPAVIIDGSNLTYRYANGLEIESGGLSGVHGLAFVNVRPGGYTNAGLALVNTDYQSSASDVFEITGNFFGVLPDGQTAAPNGVGIMVLASFATIGGETVAERNIVSGNQGDGMELKGDGLVVVGNYIGVAADGVTALGNGGDGIHFPNSESYGITDRTQVGGPGKGNVISANGDDGIHLHGRRIDVYGNLIGVGSDETTELGNGDEGISLYYGSSDNRIGDVHQGHGNVIAHNESDGIFLSGNDHTDARASTIRGNAIYLNRGLGIDLGGRDADDGDGINRNDAVPPSMKEVFSYEDDQDQGANRHQNYPEIADFTLAPDNGTLTVTYRVPSDPAHTTYPLSVDFYEATFDINGVESGFFGQGTGKSGATTSVEDSPAITPMAKTAYTGGGRIRTSVAIPVGEGGRYLATDTYTKADYQSGASKTVTVPLQQQPEETSSWIVGTATDADGHTSEFNFPFYVFSWSAGGSIAITDGADAGQTPSAKAGGDPPAHRFDTYDVTIDPSYTEQEWKLGVNRSLAPPSSLPSGRDLANYGSWSLTPADPSVDFVVEACFDLDVLTNDEAAIDFSALEVWRRPDAQSPWSNVADDPEASVTVENTYAGTTACADGLNALGEFVVVADPTALPVELTTLEAQTEADQVRLVWQTASEINNAGFHVDRRVDTGDWWTLGFVEGNGTTETARSYRFSDARLPFAADTLFYRLRQVDHNGTEGHSEEVAVAVGAPERLVLHAPFPNPARGTATLRYALPNATDVEITVYNLLGQRMAKLVDGTFPGGRTEKMVNANRWPSGTYFVRMVANGQVRTERLTVVR